MNEFLRKKWEMAGLADDYIFNKVMLDYDIEMQVADLHDIAQRKVEATDPLVVKLKERIAVVKRNRKWRPEYMRRSVYEMDQEMREKKIREGERRIRDGKREILEGKRELLEGKRELLEGKRELQKSKHEIKEGQDRLKEKEQLIQEREQKLHENQQTIIKTSIEAMRALNIDKTTIKKEIKEKFDLSDKEIKDYFAE